MAAFTQLAGAARGSIRDACGICRELFPVMIPLIIGVKVLSELDLIKYLAMPLEPLMGLMGLPSDFGIIWATSMMVNLYSGLIVLASLLPAMEPLSVAQMSTFGLIALYAHSLPIEGRIARQCGLSFAGQVGLRILVAAAAGIGMHTLCRQTGWLAEPAAILFAGGHPDPALPAWIWSKITDLIYIFGIIFVLLLVQRGIEHFRLNRWLEWALEPLLRLLGVSAKTATTIMIGMCMGLIYGSGLIIRAANDGSLSRRDIFGSVTLMGLAHAIIEDTLLFMVIGGNWIVILVMRSLLAIGVTAAVMRLRDRIDPLPEVL
ncbi:MAG: hypothetical protein LBC10_03775 [Deltaproteobacteria bacterium]|jgi:hypothetical protein|nr:hypothetical protein [Deltaproteobacteria bacterium]